MVDGSNLSRINWYLEEAEDVWFFFGHFDSDAFKTKFNFLAKIEKSYSSFIYKLLRSDWDIRLDSIRLDSTIF